MSKVKYYIATFPSSSVKASLARLSRHVIKNIDRITEILHRHSDKSHEQSAFQMLLDTMQNYESIFGYGIPDIMPSASTSSQGELSQESSSPLEGVSSSCLTQKLPFVDGTNEVLTLKSLETKSTSANSQKSAELFEKIELTSPVEDKMDIAVNKVAEMKISPKEENKESIEFKEDINNMIPINHAEIKSVSVIREANTIGVEIDIDIDLTCVSGVNNPEKNEKKSSPSKEIASQEKLKGKVLSPSGSPSKSKTLTGSLPISSEPGLTVDYLHPNVLFILRKRLLSILKRRTTCMEEIHNYFEMFVRDVDDFQHTVDNLHFVVETLPIGNEPYFSDDLLKFRYELLNKAFEMSEKAMLLFDDVKEDTNVLEKCLEEIDSFGAEYVPQLSAEDASRFTVIDLKIIESRMKEIFTKADGTVILKDERRKILFNFSYEFKWLVNHFAKFLIITGMLESPQIRKGE